MRHELVDLDERARVEQQIETFARGQFASGVLTTDAGFAAAKPRLLAQLAQVLDLLVGCLGVDATLGFTGHGGLARVEPHRLQNTDPARGPRLTRSAVPSR